MKTSDPLARIFYVYVWFRPWNGAPFYVGKGHGDRAYRFNRSRRSSAHIRRIIEKCGGVFPIVIVRDELTEAEAHEVEIALIKAIGRAVERTGPLCNRTDGGEGVVGSKHSEETRAKLSTLSKAQWTDDFRAFYSSIRRGKPRSEEGQRSWLVGFRAKIVGQKRSPESRAKMSAASLGKPKSFSHRKALSNVHTGRVWARDVVERRNTANLGKVRTPEMRARYKAAQAFRRLKERWFRSHPLFVSEYAAWGDGASTGLLF
jgi:hypothetical protein